MKKSILALICVVTISYFTACNDKKTDETVVATPELEQVEEMESNPVVETVKLEQTDGAFTTKELKLKAGTYSFEVTNKDVNHDVAFVLAPKKENIQESDYIADAMLTQVLKNGETASSKKAVTLEKGEYVYFCPLNKTPQYSLIVE